MANRTPVVLVNGELQQLQSGDTLIVTTKPDFQVNSASNLAPALRVSNLTAGGNGPGIEFFTGFGSKVVGQFGFQASGSAGATFSVQLLRQATGTITDSFSIDNTGLITFGAGAVFNGPARLKVYTVATLPAGTQGDTAAVSDALAPAFLSVVVGGGSTYCPVTYNGTNWVGY